MTLRMVIDTREQEPYSFGCDVVRRKLEAGDYSVEGFEEQVAVERKSLADFVRTCIHDPARFARELDLLGRRSHACIVVEADLDDVLRGRAAETLRGASPESMLGAAVYLTVWFGVPVFWCGSRQAARAFTEAYLRMAVRETAARRREGELGHA